MTRASAANGDYVRKGQSERWARKRRFASPRRGCAARRSRRLNARIGAPRDGRWRVIPPAASIGAAVAIIGTIALTLHHLRLEHDLALRAAAHEVDIRATLLAARLNAALIADPQAPARPKSSEAFSTPIPTSGSPDRCSSTATGGWSHSTGRRLRPIRRWRLFSATANRCLIGRRLAGGVQIPDRATATTHLRPCGRFARRPARSPSRRRSIASARPGGVRR